MHPRTKLVWGVDVLRSRNFGTLEKVDIISICTPAALHWAAIDDAIHKYGTSAIFCEKPLDVTVAGAREIVEHCREAGVILAVNHQRAWEMGGYVDYCGDPLENGTHAAELANRLNMDLLRSSGNEKFLTIQLYNHGPMVSLKAIDDIIDCIEGRKDRPTCSGVDGLRAVERALDTKRLYRRTA